MKICKIHAGHMRLPLRTPFVTALRRVEEIDDIVLIIECDNGRSGYGEAPPTAVITGDTHGSIMSAIKIIAPQLIGMDIQGEFNAMLNLIHSSLLRNTSSKAAFEIALYDLWAQSLDLPLHKALGGGVDSLKTDLTISVNPVSQMVEDALAAVKRGFDHLKIKVGKNSQEDVRRLTAIQEAVGRNIKLSIDANQGWTAKEAIKAMTVLEASGLEFDYLEQPVKADDIEGLKLVTNSISTPVLADEAVFSSRDAIKVLELHAADLINIKLMKSAGISDALRIADLTKMYNSECMIGAMLEGPISVAAAACFAAARPNVVTRFDLDGPMLAAVNPVHGGVLFNEADITLPTLPGLGITGIDGLDMTLEIK